MAVSVRQLHPNFAGQISDVDLSDPGVDALYPEFQAALDTHGVLIFSGAPLDQDRQIAFCGLFGPLEGAGANVGVIMTGIKRRGRYGAG